MPSKFLNPALERLLQTVQLRTAESEVFPQADPRFSTAEVEHGLTASADHMHMGRAVVVGVDDHAKSQEAFNSWHGIETQALWKEGC